MFVTKLPNTSSVDIWTNRGLIFFFLSLLINWKYQLYYFEQNLLGNRLSINTFWAAKLTIQSVFFVIILFKKLKLQILPCLNYNFYFSFKCLLFFKSTLMTFKFLDSKRSIKWDPINPEPPVIIKFLTFIIILNQSTKLLT